MLDHVEVFTYFANCGNVLLLKVSDWHHVKKVFQL
jgi:hypothetical protein